MQKDALQIDDRAAAGKACAVSGIVSVGAAAVMAMVWLLMLCPVYLLVPIQSRLWRPAVLTPIGGVFGDLIGSIFGPSGMKYGCIAGMTTGFVAAQTRAKFK